MKILMLCDFFNESFEYQENLLLRYYRKHGFEVTLVCAKGDSAFDYCASRFKLGGVSEESSLYGARIIKLGYEYIRFGNRLRKLSDITEILNGERPDLIYVHDIIPNIIEASKYIENNPKCKMILDYHADYSNSGRSWISINILHKLIRRRLFLDPVRKHIAKIFPIVPTGIQFLNEVYRVPLSEMELLPLGGDFDLARECQKSVAHHQVRASLRISDSDFVIFTGGKLNEIKRTHLLFEAIKAIDRPDIHLVVVGKSDSIDYANRLQSLAFGDPRFHLLGWMNSYDVYRYMAISDIAVFPASQSILWQQAICMSLPLIVGDSGGQSLEYLNDNSSIISLSSCKISAAEIAKAIVRLKDNASLRQQMRQGAAKTASESLDWNKMIYKTLRFNTNSPIN